MGLGRGFKSVVEKANRGFKHVASAAKRGHKFVSEHVKHTCNGDEFWPPRPPGIFGIEIPDPRESPRGIPGDGDSGTPRALPNISGTPDKLQQGCHSPTHFLNYFTQFSLTILYVKCLQAYCKYPIDKLFIQTVVIHSKKHFQWTKHLMWTTPRLCI